MAFSRTDDVGSIGGLLSPPILPTTLSGWAAEPAALHKTMICGVHTGRTDTSLTCVQDDIL